jgi:fucose 4-O-acetylase-like acetyltransferase
MRDSPPDWEQGPSVTGETTLEVAVDPAQVGGMAKSGSKRIAGIDIARGIAIYLMIQSHTVKGLLYFRDMPDWGIWPMHTLTKISSSLFVIVYGVTLGVIFLPRTLTGKWKATAKHLWWRALLVIFWYKVLILVQTLQTRSPDVIIDMLLYRKFPDFVEILNFYGWIMLGIPLLLPLWRKLPVWAGLGIAVGLALLGKLLSLWDFGGVVQIKAMVVEQPGYFCYGILTRGPMALFGLFLGDLIGRALDFHRRRKQLALSCVAAGLFMVLLMFIAYHANLDKILVDMAHNIGKHPPRMYFVLFSTGGALFILGLCLFIQGRGPWYLKPFEILGRESLVTFNFHIIFIFFGLRWLCGLKRFKAPEVTYGQALLLVLVTAAACIGVAMLNTARKKRKRERKRAETARLEAERESEKHFMRELDT